MEYRYNAIVLKKKDINETDRLYTFYTLEQGRVQAIARGVRKPRARHAGQLENFSLVALMVMRSRGLGNIKSALAEWRPIKLKNSFDVLQSVFMSMDIFDRLVGFEQVDKEIFLLVREYLVLQEACAQENDIHNSRLFTQAFLFQLMSISGYTFEVSQCVFCSSKISAEKPCLSYQQGGVVCLKCSSLQREMYLVSGDLIKILRLISTHSLISLKKLIVSQDHLRQLEIFVKNYIRWIEN